MATKTQSNGTNPETLTIKKDVELSTRFVLEWNEAARHQHYKTMAQMLPDLVNDDNADYENMHFQRFVEILKEVRDVIQNCKPSETITGIAIHTERFTVPVVDDLLQAHRRNNSRNLIKVIALICELSSEEVMELPYSDFQRLLQDILDILNGFTSKN